MDDAAQGITDVVRGADLLDSTPRQIWLQQLLGFATPEYLHVPVATNPAGEKLSKQTLAPRLIAADAGKELCAALRFLGMPVPADASLSAKEILRSEILRSEKLRKAARGPDATSAKLLI